MVNSSVGSSNIEGIIGGVQSFEFVKQHLVLIYFASVFGSVTDGFGTT